jgi:uncharacterized protein (TIGR02453 family)
MFKESTLKFLKGLKKNNNRDWFERNRAAYEEARADFENFIQSLITIHGKSDPDLQPLIAKKCIFRINRDVRFSKDKSPYKTNFGASMDRGGRKSGLAGYYFHLEPGNSFFAGGIWMPSPENMKKVRQEIDYCFDEFKKLVSSKKFKSVFGDLYTGEDVQLSRVPQGFEKNNPAADFLKFKSWLVISNVNDKIVCSKQLLKTTTEGFKLMQPFIQFLNRSIQE